MTISPLRSGLSAILPLRPRNLLSTLIRHSSQEVNKFDAEYLNKNEANYAQLSPISQLNKTVHQYPNVTCYVHNDLSRTWREVNHRIRRLASAMKFLGIKKNEVISIMAPNSPSIFEAHFAIPSTGAVLHSINTRSDARTIAFQLKHAETKFLFVDTEYSELIHSALALIDDPQSIFIVQILDDPKYPVLDIFEKSFVSMEYEEVLATGSPSDALSLPDDEWDAISLNYTSGTTGNPKGVVSHHRGAYLNSLANIVEWNMPMHPRFLWVVPMFHCNGWCFPWTMACAAGTSYFLRQMRADRLFHVIETYKVQYFAGAPVTMNTMLAYKDKMRFTHDVKMWAAGAPPPTSVIKRFDEEVGVKVQCAYGLTETYGPVCTHNMDYDWINDHSDSRNSRDVSDVNDDIENSNSDGSHNSSNNNSSSSSSSSSNNNNDINSFNKDIHINKAPAEAPEGVPEGIHVAAWRPLTKHELLLKSTYLSCDTTVEDLKVLNADTMEEVPADGVTIGEVMIKGNIVMKGYLRNEAATREAFRGGWFHTGDLAVHHGNGRIEIKDRSKDIIISGGENISSIEVEAILLTHELIDEAAVIAVPDEKWGEVPCAFVTLRAGKALPAGAVVYDLESEFHGSSDEPTNSEFSLELIKWARTKMAGYQAPKIIRLVECLPKTSTGKVQKNVLRDMSKAFVK